MLNYITINLDATDAFFIGAFIICFATICVLYARYQKGQAEAAGINWRKLAPYLLFVGMGVLFVFARPLIHSILGAVYGANTHPGDLNADGGTIAADQVAGGYVQLGNATSKLIMSVAFYALFSFVPWVFQQLTHPGPTAWKKAFYTTEFTALPSEQKFEVDGRLGLNAAIRVAAAIVGACLIQ